MEFFREQAPPLSPTDIQRQLERMLSSPLFVRSPRLSRFMNFVVGAQLDGRDDEIKEYSVGLEVFDRPPSFDPRLDPIVRVEATRLRRKIRDYYLTDGMTDEVMLELRRPGYRPIARRRKGVGREAGDSFGQLLPAARTSARSLAVLNLRELDGTEEYGFVGQALSNQIANALTALPGIAVASRTYTNRLRTEDVQLIGRSLNVESVLRGSLQWVNKGLRVQVQLMDTASGLGLWGDVFETQHQEALRTQDVVASRVVQALKEVLKVSAAA